MKPTDNPRFKRWWRQLSPEHAIILRPKQGFIAKWWVKAEEAPKHAREAFLENFNRLTVQNLIDGYYRHFDHHRPPKSKREYPKLHPLTLDYIKNANSVAAVKRLGVRVTKDGWWYNGRFAK